MCLVKVEGLLSYNKAGRAVAKENKGKIWDF
jgi:hypothetical protein